jgi:regulator of sigma E protease
MSQVLTPLLYVIGVGGMFLILIAPHEAGHFLFAKLFKVRVIEFSVGAGTKLWSFTRGGTLYAVRALPILGYVRMGGMEEGDFDEPNGFHSKPAWQRIVILAGGPAANFLVAMVIVTGFQLTQLNSVPIKVVEVMPGSPAASAGFRAGDSIQTVNGRAVTSQVEMRKLEDAARGATIVVGGVHSNGQHFQYVVTPVCTQGTCQVGVQIKSVLSAGAAISNGVAWPVQVIGESVQGLRSLISGQVPGGLLGTQGPSGPIGIIAITASAVSAGPPTYLLIVALLSVVLGLTNLLPLLALDGGRIVVVAVEWVRRRPFDRNSELNFQRWGLVALLVLVAVISVLDIRRWVTGSLPGVH